MGSRLKDPVIGDLAVIVKITPFCYHQGHTSLRPSYVALDRGQTREICEKQEKYFKGKVVTLTVQSLILCQYPVDLLTFFEFY